MSDWKFEVDEVGPDAEPEEDLGPPIEPEQPTLENIIPFLAGVGLALFIFLQVI